MIHSTVEAWGNNKIAEALIDTKLNKTSYLAFAIFEIGVELLSTNLCVFEYAGRAVTHIALSPFLEDYKFLTGINYLVEGLWKTVVAVLLDYFIIPVAIYRVATLHGEKTSPLFEGPTNAYKSQLINRAFQTV